MRATFLWSNPTGYLAASLLELATAKGWEIRLVSRMADPASTALYTRLDAATDWQRLDDSAYADPAHIRALVESHDADAVVFPGWFHKPYTALASDALTGGRGRVMAMDTPWRGTWRQRLARYRLRAYLARMHQVVCAGARTVTYARALGIPPASIRTYLYGYDARGFGALERHPQRRFLYVGRYAPEKGLPTLAEAYRQYRAAVSDPWELHLCGRGPADGGLLGSPGVTDHGFVAPDDLPAILAASGAFVFPSLYEPFGLALVEACGAGLPVIVSEEVGAAVECVRDHVNGHIFPAGDAAALADRMRRIHEAGPDRLAEMGASGIALAEPFAERHWATRWDDILRTAARMAGRGDLNHA